MMKKIALAIVAALAALSVHAFDFGGSGFVPQEGDGASGILLSDETGGSLTFEGETEATPERISALRAIVAELRSWKGLEIAELRAINREDWLQVIVLPSAFTVEGYSLMDALPEGIQLFHDSLTEYDFKIVSGDRVVRLRSAYAGELELDGAALAAFKRAAPVDAPASQTK